MEMEFSIIVNKPLIIEAKWPTEHLVKLFTDPEHLVNKALEFKEEWLKSGTSLLIIPKDEDQVSNDTKYVFIK
ncbi:MAG: hypothetical protein QXR45_08425 [Candidatus Bathyarchaeia archaeon]